MAAGGSPEDGVSPAVPSFSSATEAGEAHLDPWCLAQLDDGTRVLFGYAHAHPETGGLAWLSSSEVLELHLHAGSATTRSGRRYRLGRRFDSMDVGAETAEARLAFDLLLGSGFDGLDELRELDRTWLSACKAARHLDLPIPARTVSAVREFVKLQLPRYIALRRNSL